jgi:hypothetical protein
MKSASAKLQLAPQPPAIDPALIDEYCDLREKMKAWKPSLNPHAARFDELKTLILASVEKEPANRPIVAPGTRWTLPITARHIQRSVVNLAAFFKVVGRDRYLELCSPTLAAVENEISAEQVGRFITSAQTGGRTIGEPVRAEAQELRLAA